MIKGSGYIQPVSAYLGMYSTSTDAQAFRSLQQHWRGPRENTENADDLDFAQVGHGLFIILWPVESVPEQISMMRRVWLMDQWWDRNQSINVQALNALTISTRKHILSRAWPDRPELIHFSGRRIAPVPNMVAEYGNWNGAGVGSVEFLEWEPREGGRATEGKRGRVLFWGLRKSVVLRYYKRRNFSVRRESEWQGI